MTGALWGETRAATEMDEDAAFWGIPRHLLDTPEPQTGVWEEHIPAVEAYLAIGSQWRVVPRFGEPPRFLGLDYSAAETGLRLAGIDITPELWAEVRLIEQGAKAALNGE